MSNGRAYYNEIDPYCAEWLRNLISAGHIAPGDVDERSIEDVRPDDVRGYTQCHYFAGIGVWSYALRLAGWPDDRPVWTGSCPCQPFSQAGKGIGFADERHLWPAWHHLIRECRPSIVFGEQVEAAIAHGWLDLVQDDLEAEGYAFAPFGLPAASVGAPNIRQRLWFVAHSGSVGWERWPNPEGRSTQETSERSEGLHHAKPCGVTSELGNADDARLERRRELGRERAGEFAAGSPGVAGAVEYPDRAGSQPRDKAAKAARHGCSAIATGFWADAEWIVCRDGKARPVKPGVFPLVDGYPGRVGILRAAGNAINPQVAATFISACM